MDSKHQTSISNAAVGTPAQTPGGEIYYRALCARDTRYDGVFFTAVKTTGVYCRPVCKVKTPKATSCTFFASAAAAEAAGYRPCLRCRPELAPYAVQQNLAHAVWQMIAAGALNDGDTEALAEKVGLSSRQLRRILLEHFGVTPVELAQTQRLLFAKKLLQETQLPMAELAFAAGFGSVRRFNALFAERYGMAPGSIRRTAADANRPDAVVLRLAYRPPYAWSALKDYLGARAMPGLESVIADEQGAAYVRSVRLEQASGWIKVSHRAEREQIELEISPSLAGVLMPLVARVRKLFDLDANPEQIASHLSQDALLAAQIERFPGIRVPGSFDPFELAVRAILGQQVSVAGATTLAGRLVKKFGDPTETPFAEVTHHFPTPAQLAAQTVADLRAIGLPQKRAETLQGFASFARDGGLQFTPGTTLEAVVARLCELPGIGPWTAQYIAMRALSYPDALPSGDLGLLKAVTPEGEARRTTKQLDALSTAWSPWRAYATMLLWYSLT